MMTTPITVGAPVCRRPTDRLVFIDAARGIAMLLVCLAHFGYVYFASRGGHTREVIAALGLMASPAFVIISGFMLGFLYRTRPYDFNCIRKQLVDRGIFLLTIGHLLILMAHLPIQASWRWGFITDAIGFNMIAGPLLITKMRPSARLLVSAALYGFGWLAVAWWHPSSTWLRFVEDTLFGSTDVNLYLYNFPIVPWFSLYFASSVIGEQVGARHLERNEPAMRRGLGVLAIVSTAVGIVGTILALAVIENDSHLHPARGRPLYQAMDLDSAWRAAELLADPGATPSVAVRLTSPFQKLPPSPIYFAFYGGIALSLLFGCYVVQQRPALLRILKWTGSVGRASLFTFVVQYYAYYTVLRLLALPPSSWWPIYFIGSALLIGWLAGLWSAHSGNRFITVGYPWVLAGKDVPPDRGSMPALVHRFASRLSLR